MTLTTLILLNVALDAAMLALLAFVMTRPRHLNRHNVAEPPLRPAPERPRSEAARARRERPFQPVLDR